MPHIKFLPSRANSRSEYLARIFGPDEIQLCVIQAAGLEVSGLVNCLLEGCFDNKFEVRFRNPALRHQINVMRGSQPERVRLSSADRLL